MLIHAIMRKPNYDKYPATKVSGDITVGWEAVSEVISENSVGKVIAVELYSGVFEKDIIDALSPLRKKIVLMSDIMKPCDEVRAMTEPFMTDDCLFGHMADMTILDFMDKGKLDSARLSCDTDTIVIGEGSSLVASEDALIVYADMARWEIQRRFRRHEVHGLGIDNSSDCPSVQYKRGYFIDWNILDIHKENIMRRVDFWLDTNDRNVPKLISSEIFLSGLAKTASKPFRVVPFFDPAPWGGQWMKTVCCLDPSVPNYGWCFDCVPEENSLFLESGGVRFELPSQDLVMYRPSELMGDMVAGKFGTSFPIRFDFLDTMDGGNLSVQVHPTLEYIRKEFGMAYTQDESYYLLDAKEDACVYLGVRNDADREAMLSDLRAAQRGELVFDAEKYINRFPAKKHDHYLIPAGTIHCSGANSMVLEISATPSIFTFKLWDWQRLGLDGKPRPINVERGTHVINWSRDTDYVKANQINRFEPIAEGDCWDEIRTGLHPAEFIETRRVRFTKQFTRDCGGSVNVLNLVDGDEAIVESKEGSFEPLVVHYAETFIIPESCKEYSIRPYGQSEGKECMVIIASVRPDALDQLNI